MREKWELVDLELPEMPGLGIIVETSPNGDRRPAVISQPHGAILYAAAWRDGAGVIHDWFELWVQDIDSWRMESGTALMPLSNPMLDRQWLRMVEAHEAADPEAVFRFGWEQRHPAPIFLDETATRRSSAEGEWQLCTDDSLLESARLAPFSGSLHRYLANGEGSALRMIPSDADAPRGPCTFELRDVFPKSVAVNPWGGLMMLRRASALLLDDFSDLIAGVTTLHPLESIRIPPCGANLHLLERPGSGSRHSGFFFSRSQSPGHLGELLHLKLVLLRSALASVSQVVERTAAPFLAIRPDAFGVSLADVGENLPYLWNHRVSLLAPPQSVRTEVGDVREPCFMPAGDQSKSLYRALRVESEIRGVGRVRIRRVSAPDDDGLVIVEGSLVTDESLQPGKLDLLALEWTSNRTGRFKLYAKMEPNAEARAGEYRFASLQTRLPVEVAQRLSGDDATLSSDRVSFHLLPRLGTPCDLYSCGVLACRILLVGPGLPLAEALDDLLKMSRLYRNRFSDASWNTGTASLHEFVKTGEGGPWAEKLGPHRLVGGRIEHTEAMREIPAVLWWQVIEVIAKLFPGEALGSFCKSYDDFSPRALHETFAEPLAALDSLTVRTRELLFGNPRVNQEILDVVRSVARKARG